MVECTPLGTAVNEVTIDDKTAALTDKFCPFVIMNELSAPAFRADGLSMILGLFLDLFTLRA
jgi:hypothetical protein